MENIRIPKNAAEILTSVDTSERNKKETLKLAQEHVSTQVDIISKAENLPELTALLKSFKENCQSNECLEATAVIKKNILNKLGNFIPANNTDYRPANEIAA